MLHVCTTQLLTTRGNLKTSAFVHSNEMAAAAKLPRVDSAATATASPSQLGGGDEVDECSICMDSLKEDSDIGRLKCVSLA